MLKPSGRVVLALFAALLGAAPLLAVEAPLPIAPAERAAVEAVADFLSRGPVAIVERLSEKAPLRKMPSAKALEQIEIVTGPPERASWELCTQRAPERIALFHVIFASGADDFVAMDMVEEAGSWKISALRMYGEVPSFLDLPEEGTTTPLSEILKQSGPHVVLDEKPPHDYRPLIGALIAAVIALISSYYSRALSRVFAVVAVALFALQVHFAMKPEWRMGGMRIVEKGEPAPRVSVDPTGSASALLAFRRQMASRLDAPPPGPLSGKDAAIAKLWQCQLALERGDRKAAEKLLGTDLRAPLASLLRARLLSGRGDQRANAASAYDDAQNHGGFNDQLALEKAIALSWSRSERGPSTVGDALGVRSRDAAVYYMRAIEAMVDDKALEAGECIRLGWALRPSSREHFVSTTIADSPLFVDPGIVDMVHLHSPDEAKVRDPELSTQAIAVPNETISAASGRFLRLRIGTNTLDVPGGAALAPLGTEVVAVTFWNAEEESEALEDVAASGDSLKTEAISPFGSWRLERAAAALAAHNRWEDLARITDGVTPEAQSASRELFCLRLTALLKLRRIDAARALAQGALAKEILEDRRDSTTQAFVAETLAQVGSYAEAIELYKRAQLREQAAQIEVRIRQLELLLILKTLPATARTTHFELRCSPDVTPALANRIAEILESELARLKPIIGLKEFRPVVVNVLGWDDFRLNVTGSDYVVGVYDGEITFPFATATRFNSTVVSVLTHELTHAIVAQASGDNAPRWFQEGIATRMELVDGQRNIFAAHGTSDLRPFVLIDATMTSSLDPVSVVDSYTHAQTFMRFLESRYGNGVLAKIIAAYRGGANSEDALLKTTGKSTEALDREFRVWGASHRDPFSPMVKYPYDKFYSPGVDPAVQSGIKFSKRGGK